MTLEAAKGMLTYISHAYDYGDVYSRDDLEAIDTVLKALEISQINYDTLCQEIAQVTKDLGLPEDIIIADEMAEFIKEKYISKEKVREKIKELEEYKNNFWTTGEHDVAEDMNDYYELEQEIDLLQELLGEWLYDKQSKRHTRSFKCYR